MDFSNLANGDGVFWVDTDDSMPCINLHEVAKMMARGRQEVMANELSRLACYEYFEDIMQHMHRLEDETLPDTNLIDQQVDIQWFMRPYLIDFVIEAHSAFMLLPETLYLTVNLLDRYCSRRTVFKNHYQLVGCAALLIASKYSDKKDSVPRIVELNNMCCQLYDTGMFTQMEMHVLNTLGWNIGHPTVDFFARVMATTEQDSVEVQHMAAYLSEMALYHRDFVSTKPSTMARASLALARAILGQLEAKDDHEWHHAETMTVANLWQVLDAPTITLQRKYASAHYSEVAAKLDNFLVRHAAMQQLQQRAIPSTPSCEQDRASLANAWATPQKGLGAVSIDGYMTPPITPDGAHFVANGNPMAQDYPMPPRCSITPSPQPSFYGQPPLQHMGQVYFEPAPTRMSHVSY